MMAIWRDGAARNVQEDAVDEAGTYQLMQRAVQLYHEIVVVSNSALAGKSLIVNARR